MVTFSEVLKRLRGRAGMSQQQVADLVGVSRPTVAKWERGGDTDSETKMRLAEIFHVTPQEVFGLGNTNRPMSPPGGAVTSAIEIIESRGGEAYTFGQLAQFEVVGEISCGPAGQMIERREGIKVFVDVGVMGSVLADPENWYWLRVVGNSMVRAGYYPGGLALIHRQDSVDSGDIAVVCIHGEQHGGIATLKRVIHHPALHAVELRAEADGYEPQFLPEESVTILGRARMGITIT